LADIGLVQLTLDLPPDYVDHPVRRDPLTGQTFRFDPTCKAFLAVFWIVDGIEETHRTAISFAQLQRSRRIE